MIRPRRLRTTPTIRRLVRETHVTPDCLVQPLFVKEGLDEPRAVSGMPGVLQHCASTLLGAVGDAAAAGVGAVMLFGIPADRDPEGSAAVDPNGILSTSVRAVRDLVGDDLVVMADLCLDEFTSHGHCGVLDDRGRVDNDATLSRYARMAQVLADAGAHLVAPSGMMDGQVAAIRQALDQAAHTDVAILAYAAKYASAFYGPFREAVDSALEGDRRSYQMDPANRREAAREVRLDLAEGADLVMVKPAMSYLDVLADVAALSPVPVAAYQVSGEYAMVEAAAGNGWLDREAVIDETLLSIRRAGADIVLTYWATEVAQRARS